MQKRLLLCTLSVFALNCMEKDDDEDLPAVSETAEVAVFPGGVGNYNGGSYNGGSYNGGSYNGGSYNGGSYNGGSYNGGTWAEAYLVAGFGMNGASKHIGDNSGTNQGFDGTTYNIYSGLGWTYNESTLIGTRYGMALSTSTANPASLLGIHDWISHTDTNGNQGPISAAPPHYCAGFESQTDTYMNNQSIAANSTVTFQRSSGGGPVSIQLIGTATTELHIRNNALPVVGAGSTVNDYNDTSSNITKSFTISMNPGDTAFIRIFNNSAVPASITVTSSAGGTPSCDDPADVNDRLNAIQYLLKCMCPSSVSVTFGTADTHLSTSTTLAGALNLGPTWCTGSMNTVVPEDELQMVSACYTAHLNGKGTHVPISIRGSTGDNTSNPSLNPTVGELIMDATPIGMYFGNFFSAGHGCRGVGATTTNTVPGLVGFQQYECCSGTIDTTTNQCIHSDGRFDGPSYDQHWEQTSYGKWWLNSERFVSQRGEIDGEGNYVYPSLNNDWVVTLGRTCDVDGCGRLVNVGTQTKNLPGGALGFWPITGDGLANPNYTPNSAEGLYTISYANIAKQTLPAVFYACQTPTDNQLCDSDYLHPITGGGRAFRQMNLYVGLMANLEPSKVQASGYVPPDPVLGMMPAGDDSWSYSQLASGSAALLAAQEVTCGTDSQGYSNCIGGTRLTGLTSAQSILSIFQYKPVGSIQWLPQGSSINYAEAFSVAVRYSSTATSTLRIWAQQSPLSSNVSWTAYGASPIVSGGAESYRTMYLYPVYMKPNTVGSQTIPQISVKLSGPANGNPAPDLDAVQVFVGPPPCTPNGVGFCSSPS